MSDTEKDEYLPVEERSDRYYHYTEPDGSIVKMDILTGEQVGKIPRIEDGLIPGQHTPARFVKGNSKLWHYNEIYKDLICNLVEQGKTMKVIGETPGFPSSGIIARWRANNEDFSDALIAARQARAERHADDIAEAAENMRGMDKEEIPAEKLFIETKKWLASKDDPQRYGTAIKHSNDSDNPMQIIVSTGIDRTPVDLSESSDRPDILIQKEEEDDEQPDARTSTDE